ncbi:MAG: PAS domain-containing protein, partial [Leptospirales bacterium]|nr:PAS domain-containing protein [Leptospirales bacterium]
MKLRWRQRLARWLDGRPRASRVLAVLAATAAVGAVIVFLNYRSHTAFLDARRQRSALREARRDLTGGFLMLLDSGGPQADERRDAGRLLLNRASAFFLQQEDDLKQYQADLPGAAGPHFAPAELVFRQTLLRWSQAPASRRAALNAELFGSYQRLTLAAEQVDAASQRAVEGAIAGMDRQFQLAASLASFAALMFLLWMLVNAWLAEDLRRRQQESELRLRLLGDNLPDSYVYQYEQNERGYPRFIYVSAGVERVHGIPVAAAMGDPMLLLAQLDAEAAPRLAAAEIESKRTLLDFSAEIPFRRADGVPRILALRSRPRRTDRGGIVWDGVAADISAARNAEAAARSSLQRFEELVATIDEVFYIATPDFGKMLYLSPAYERIWGRTVGSCYMQPQGWLDAIHPEDRERRRAAAAAPPGGSFSETYRVVRPDGGQRWVSERGYLIYGQQQWPLRLIGSVRDITREIELEAQMRQAQKLEAIGQLAGGVAHDFNNILAVIMMQLELLERDAGLSAEVRDTLKVLRSYALRAAALTRQLLVVGRREIMQQRRLGLNQAVEQISEMLRRTLPANIALQLDLYSDELEIMADTVMLDQILMNLAVNARDAMPAGGVLSFATGRVTLLPGAVRGFPDLAAGDYAFVRVDDNGEGIAPQAIDHLFEPFFTTKPPGKGTGLGLSTVLGIVQQHSGGIQ